MGRTVDKASMMLEWEEFRLLRWGESVGLHAGRNHDPRLNWSLIHDLLEHLLRDVLNAEKLRSKYNLDVVEEAGAGDSQSSVIVGPTRERSVPGQTWRHVSPAIRQSRERILQQTSSIWSKLKWVKVDEEKTIRLLADISYFNTALQECLDAAQQDFMKQGMAALLRDLLSRTTSGAEVETIDEFLGEEAVADHKALQAVSTLKQTRLLLSRDASNGIDSRQGEHSGLHSTRPQLTRVKYEHLSMSKPSNPDRSVADCNLQDVFESGEYQIARSA